MTETKRDALIARIKAARAGVDALIFEILGDEDIPDDKRDAAHGATEIARGFRGLESAVWQAPVQ